MADNLSFIEVNNQNIEILRQFLSEAGNSLNSFRYYNTRTLAVIIYHVCTYILMEDNFPVGYGHLDREDDKVWLGIAVSEKAKGKGYGSRIMQKLISAADSFKINKIYLSVDQGNTVAIALYRKFGFMFYMSSGNTLFFIKTFHE